MSAFRPVFASVLVAVLAAGGVVLPAVHRATHALETAAERSAHVSDFHQDTDGDRVQTPCPPALHGVDCAICAGLWAAADLTSTHGGRLLDPGEGASATADWIRLLTATGAGARAPPIG